MSTSSTAALKPAVLAGLFLVGVLALVWAGPAFLVLRRQETSRDAPVAARPMSAKDSADLRLSMEKVEEPTESFANALHGCSLSLRDGEASGLAACLAPTLEATSFPAAPGEVTSSRRWFQERSWPLAPSRRQARERFLTDAGIFLDHFSSVEDARLKVLSSRLQDGTGDVEAVLKISLVGRDSLGRREWTRGRMAIEAGRQAAGSWWIHHLKLEELASMTASRDLFSEVAVAAGLYAVDPPVMEHPTLGLAAHGAAAADVNGDGLLDLFVTGAYGNSLYVNGGDGTFTDVAAAAWVKTLPVPGTAPLFFDLENDGDPDLFISANGEQYLFENRMIPDGRLRFRDISLPAGVHLPAVGFSVAAGDLDGNGFTDLYVASYNHYGQVLPDRWDHATNGTANLLFMNQGDGTFREEAAVYGVADNRWSYAASMVDIDDDGLLDLYVANDFGGGNALYLQRNGRFVDLAKARGVLDSGYGMGVSFADYDNDGDLDLHVTEMSSTAGRRILARLNPSDLPSRGELQHLAGGNALYRNDGHGFFRSVSREAGPFSAGWAWGGGFFDLDNDGWEDLYTPNGFLSGNSMKDT
ncbi:MAG: FG-GAP repeat domain-containing protein [Acidobacteriota bacterium]